jgi:hypothetical protein
MSDEVEVAVADVLRTRGDGAVDVAALRVGSFARVRANRRRRVGLVGVTAVLMLVGMAAVVPVVSEADLPPTFGGAFPSIEAPDPRIGGIATPLPPSDEPGAAVGPELVGRDPGTFHFDVDTAAIGATGMWYSISDGVESASAWNGSGQHLDTWYYLAQKREDFDRLRLSGQDPITPVVDTQVFGRPAKLANLGAVVGGSTPVRRLSWQPVDGLWVTVDVRTDDPETVMKAAVALKLNRSQRCVAPFQIGTLPAGFRWTDCSVGLGPSKPWEASSVGLTNAQGNHISVSIGNSSTDQEFAASTTVRGRPAQWIDRSERHDGSGVSVTPAQLFIPIQDWVNLSISGRAQADVTRAEAVQVGELVDVSVNLTDPATWPVRPVG